MDLPLPEVALSFDSRAGNYARNEWHRRYAERLVALARLRPGDRVLDAGTGTGFAALAAARAVGPAGRVLGVDISPGMLRQAARAAVGLANLEWHEGDALHLPQFSAGAFDAILCASALLYMPAHDALREWRRLLRPEGLVAFSTMRAGAPAAARIFRECANEFGVTLHDPSEMLGSEPACRRALETAGFAVVNVVSETVDFTDRDLTLAWESNFWSAANSAVQRLGAAEQRALERLYLDALARSARENPRQLSQADVLYAFGRPTKLAGR